MKETKVWSVILAFGIMPMLVHSTLGNGGDNKKALLELTEKVFHDNNWQTCGKISVFPDGTYNRVTENIWKKPAEKKETKGRVDAAVLGGLKKLGVDKYEYYIDDVKTKHPEAILRLIDATRQQDR